MSLRAWFRELDGVIDTAMWIAAFDAGALIGLCDRRGCGGALKVLATGKGHAFEVVGGVAWFSAICLRCATEVAFPDGRAAGRARRGNVRAPSRTYAAARAALREMTADETERDRAILGEKAE